MEVSEHWRDSSVYENLRVWLEFSRGLSRTNIANILYTAHKFQKYLQDELQIWHWRDVTRREVERYLSERMSRPVRNRNKYPSPNTIRSIRNRLVVAFEFWQECGYIDHNPVKPVKGPKEHRVLVPPLEDEDVERILNVEIGNTDRIIYRNRAIVHFLAHTGVRADELTQVTLSEVLRGDVLAERFHVKGKGSKDRIVGIPLAVREVLPDYLRARNDLTDRLFVDAYGEPMAGTALRALMGTYREALKLPKLGTHDLRRWCFNKMVRDGVDINIIKQLGGWSTWEAAWRYIWYGTAQKAAEFHADYDPAVNGRQFPRILMGSVDLHGAGRAVFGP